MNHSVLGLILAMYWAVLLTGNAIVMLPLLRPSSDHRDGAFAGSLSLAIAGGFLTLTVADHLPGLAKTHSPPRPRVGLFEPRIDGVPGQEWGSSLNAHGLANIGLYGDLPVFLRRIGSEVAVLDSLTDLSRATCDVLACPSFRRPLEPAERTAIRAFLADGGCLIAAAEHTNLESNATTLNDLLEGMGLQVNFDTTHNLYAEGRLGTRCGSSALGRALGKMPYVQHNRGASLELDAEAAEPVLIGRFWLSDFGDSLAPDRAFMGDGYLSPGDQVGSLVLMAEARTGLGKVFLSGDSSVFLNQNLAYNSKFLSFLFTIWPVIPEVAAARYVAIATSFVVLGCVVWGTGRSRLRRPWTVVGIAFVAGALLAADHATGLDANERMRVTNENRVIISTEENNLFDRDPFGERSITALGLAAFRSGAVPEIGDWREHVAPRCVFVVNPTGGAGAKTPNELRALANAGTHVVLAGDGDNECFVDLASTFGFTVTGRPVGSVRGDRFTTYTAWVVESLPAPAEAFAANGNVFGGTIALGRGAVTVIADGGVLLSKNLEQDYTFDARNCGFLEDLIGTVGP